MNELIVKKVNITTQSSWNEIQKSLESVSWNQINIINWADEFDYCPDVQFRMAYCESAFLLQYQVEEQSVRAIANSDNGEVWKDSCVEFFISPDNGKTYYNFEFSCAGICLLATGASRNNRKRAPLETIAQIKRLPSLGNQPFEERKGEIKWDIVLMIPFACLFEHPNYSPEGKTVSANFYKCGDELAKPHFLSWNPIETENPDFHRPEFFGMVKFE